MFGVRNTVGATIIPLTAPSAAAKPQPSASSQPVRTPSRRAASRFRAPARIASPSFVKRKNRYSTTTQPMVTPNVPTSCLPMWTPPITHDVGDQGLGKNLISGDQIQAARPFRITSSAIVAITTVNTLARSSGRMIVRWIVNPPAKAMASVAKNAHHLKFVLCPISAQAMYVENIAISP